MANNGTFVQYVAFSAPDPEKLSVKGAHGELAACGTNPKGSVGPCARDAQKTGINASHFIAPLSSSTSTIRA